MTTAAAHLIATSLPKPMPPAEAARPALKLLKVRMIYAGQVTALHDVNLQIPAGQHAAILGASGSGKSTLLGCVSGRLTPTAGQVHCDGRIAVIHQDLRLVKQRSALANVLHGAMGRQPFWRSVIGYPRPEKQRAIELLKRVGLGHRIHWRVGRLSGGEQQRVAIARALMQDPAILLADEPVAALDQVNAKAIMELLTSLGRERELTIVSVLHDCVLAENYADRIIGLQDGELVYDGVPGTGMTFDPCRACKTIEETTPVLVNGQSSAKPPTDRPLLARLAGYLGMAVVAAVVYVWAFSGLEVDQRQLQDILPGLGGFAQRVLPDGLAQVRDLPWGQIARSLVQTLQMSLIGTTLGVLISWPLAALAAKNVGPRWIRPGMRFVLNTVRTVPSLIWALLFVAAVGLGPLTGVLALVAYSVGYLTKFFYEAFEAVDPGPPGALAEIGANGPQRFLHAVWPAATPAVLSSSLFMLEYNVRAASVLGIVGAGGIGYDLKMFIDWGNFTAVAACLILLLAVVVVLDQISTRVRAWLVKP